MGPPLDAPDWVKPAWEPIPYDYPSYGAEKTIECNPNGGAVLVDGPQEGQIYPVNSGHPKAVFANKYGKVVGTYELIKQCYAFKSILYWRYIYQYKPIPGMEIEPPKFEPKKPSTPTPSWGDLSKAEKAIGEYTASHYNNELYPGPDLGSYSMPVASKGTHASLTFNLHDVDPKVLEILYGKAAELDPWDEPEEKDEPALWEQI